MTNNEIARKFKMLSSLLELYDANKFKIRSVSNAYLSLRKYPEEIFDMPEEKRLTIPGIGKTISAYIGELQSKGSITELDELMAQTPKGVIDMLRIKGFGPKKIKLIWQEKGIDNIEGVLEAIESKSLLSLKGFGEKTVKTLKEQIAYFLESENKFLYAQLHQPVQNFIDRLKDQLQPQLISLSGQMHQKATIVDKIDLIHTLKNEALLKVIAQDYPEVHNGCIAGCKIVLHESQVASFYFDLINQSSGKQFLAQVDLKKGNYSDEAQAFEAHNLPYYIPEFRADENIPYMDHYVGENNIVSENSIKGCIHNHSTYSDGMQTLEEMVLAARSLGYEYFVITDHSQSAFYANGLRVDRLMQQIDEVISLDQKYDDIKVFSGIESDILYNGNLDYPDDVLSQLDVVIASVHAQLRMDMETATKRIISAVEHPNCNILGHPTGRLLLTRKGYPIDHKKVIDACAANDVAIEINANPKRLDIDWRHVGYAVEKGVLISINPDAHSTKGILDTQFGIFAARKAGLSKSNCLNAMDLEEFEEWLGTQYEKRR